MQTSGIEYKVTIPVVGLEGFDQIGAALSSLTKSINAATANIDKMMANAAKSVQSVSAVGEATKSLKGNMTEASNKIAETSNNVGGLSSTLERLGPILAAAFSVEKIIEMGKSILEVTAEFQGYQNRISFASKDSKDAAINMEFLKGTVNDLHLPIKQVYEGFSQMEGGLKGTAVEGDNLRKLFTGISTAAATLHIPNNDIQHLLYDLKEIGEVGVHSRAFKFLPQWMPGIADVVKKGFGMGMEQLKESGISGADFLVKLGPMLTEHFKSGIASYSTSLQAAMVDAANAVYEKQVEVGEKLEGFYKGILGGLRNMAFDAGDITIRAIEFTKLNFADMGQDISQISKIVADGLGMIPAVGASQWKDLTTKIADRTAFDGMLSGAGKVFSDFIHTVWEGVKPFIESIWQFKDQAVEVFKAVGSAIVFVIKLNAEYIKTLWSAMATIVDVAHTIYVILEKLYVIEIVKDIFLSVYQLMQGIGYMIEAVYDHTLKPIFDKIAWAYAQIKDLLGIKPMTLTHKVVEGLPEHQGQVGPWSINTGNNMLDAGASAPDSGVNATLSEARNEVSAKGEGNKVRNVTVNMDNLVGSINTTYDQIKDNPIQLKEMLLSLLIDVVRDGELALGHE